MTWWIVAILIVAGVIVADQVSKLLVLAHLFEGQYQLIPGVLHFTYVENRGMAFGMLSEHRWVFMLFSTVAILALGVYLFRGVSYLSDKREDGTYPPIAPLGGIALVVASDFIHLVQQDHGIYRSCLPNRFNDLAGHGSYVGAAVSSDLSLVVHAAQRDACKFPSRGSGDGLRHRGLSRSRRANETKDLPVVLGHFFQYYQGFKDAFLDLC